ncbi:MAG TPA: YceI family protein [Pyrinomonadaceae bacterium]|jgi:polyisoprenoid-binding protein YceI|nr:YceI family protein [Pyrinomonadaceae bacterium]
MRKFRNPLLAASFAALALAGLAYAGLTGAVAQTPAKVAFAPIAGGEYRIDPAHSTIGFAIKHYEINWVSGRFKDFAGTIRYDEQDPTKSSVEFTAKVESIDTGVAGRDKHLRTADFFDIEKYPEMTFKSTRVERKGKSWVLHGDLTLHGVTKPVALPFQLTGAIKDPRGATRFGVEAQTKIDRREFGITWGKALEGGGFDLGHEVTINLQLEAVKAAPPKPAGQ